PRSTQPAASRRKRAFSRAQSRECRSFAAKRARRSFLSASARHLRALSEQLELAARPTLRGIASGSDVFREERVRHRPLVGSARLLHQPSPCGAVHSLWIRFRETGGTAARSLVAGRTSAAECALSVEPAGPFGCRRRCIFPITPKEAYSCRAFAWRLSANPSRARSYDQVAAGRQFRLRVAVAGSAHRDPSCR